MENKLFSVHYYFKMSVSLIIYSSTDGHTKTICERIKSFLNEVNETKITSLDEAIKLDLSELDEYLSGKSPLKTSHEINGNRLLRQKNNIYFKRLNN